MPSSHADGFLESLRDIDLNEYALGAFVLTSQSYYEGIDNSTIVYPAPTKFGTAITEDETFFIRDGDVGLRKHFSGGWDLGAVASVQTLGYGSGTSLALAGMSRRDWTVQMGAVAGRDFGGFRIDAMIQTDILGEHDGQEYTLKFAKPLEWQSNYLVPQIDVLYQSADLVNHYFGVRPGEALPGRPAYEPGAAVTYSASLEWGWRFNPKWFFYANAAVDTVPSEIRNSPIVDDKEFNLSLSLGIAYDAPTMKTVGTKRVSSRESSFEIGVGAFFAHTDAKVFLTSGSAVIPVDLESEFSVDNSEVIVPIDLVWRIGRFHRLELGYFQLKRSGANDLIVPVEIGPVTFPAGDTVQSSVDTSIYKLAYAFSLMRDSQKELSLIGGVHVTDIAYRSDGAVDTVVADTTTLMPILGADLTVNFTDRLALEAELQFWLSDFNSHSGNLTDFGVSARYRISETFSFSAGFKFYRQDIDSADEDFFGDYRFEYRGPIVDIRARF